MAAGDAAAQTHDVTDPFPFFVGERLTYRVQIPRMHASGRGAMWVEGPTDVRGTSALVLRFESQAGFGPFNGKDRTASWIDARRMVSLRFTKYERHVLAHNDEQVEIYPAARRWESKSGAEGTSLTDEPLDELSFIYFIRTLPLDGDSTYHFNRHFEAGRNPVVVRVLGRATVETGGGTFRTILVEMRVKDPQRYAGEGIIRIHLSDDRCRIPVWIESTLPKVGLSILTLESHTHPVGHLAWVP